VVDHFKNLLYRVIGEDIQLITNLEPNLPNIEADSSQIDQILMNLSVNARDAMPQGGTLSIKTTLVQRQSIPNLPDPDRPNLPDYYVLLTVSDTGMGMNEETRKRIFEPFFTTKAVGKGTGLGLATVYGVVNQSQGHIVVDSEEGKGTTFYIYLPAQAKMSHSPQLLRSTIEQAQGDEFILLVEDEKDLRTLIRKFLTKLGYTVLEAEDPEDALMLFETHGHKIDLLLTDVIMPYMSGYDLALHLQNLRPNLKVLYISGYTDDVLSQYGLEVSQVPLLEKPFSSESLGRKIREALFTPVIV
jgi:CheY-like chemotaxis protein